jgi:hypothetical protein
MARCRIVAASNAFSKIDKVGVVNMLTSPFFYYILDTFLL